MSEVKATAGAIEAAAELGVDLSQVQGSGLHGKITKPDVEAVASQVDLPENLDILDRVEVYADQAGDFWWRAVARNNKVIGESQEGYVNRSYAIKVARESNPGAPIVPLV